MLAVAPDYSFKQVTLAVIGETPDAAQQPATSAVEDLARILGL